MDTLFNDFNALHESRRYNARDRSRFHLSRPYTQRATSKTADDSYTGYGGFSERTQDWTHPNFYALQRLKREGKLRQNQFFQEGHPFCSTKVSVSPPSVTQANAWQKTSVIDNKIVGALWPSISSFSTAQKLKARTFPSWNSNHGLPWVDLISLGATGISRSLPGIPEISLSTFLGELREGLPAIPGSLLKRDGLKLRNVGGEYLNYQFGVAPLVSDISKLIQSPDKFQSKLDTLYREANRPIRRRRVIRDTTETTTTEVTGKYPGPSALGTLFKSGTLRTTKVVRQRVWFSGTFKYRLDPNDRSFLTGFRDFNRVMGVLPNVSTAWELTPYSWLVDYFLNTGSVVKNISYLGVDGLYMQYGYVMGHTTTEVTETWTGPMVQGSSTSIVNTSVTTTWDVKQRLRASPFGFGLKLSDLSSGQLGILTALGLSRLKV